VNVCPDQGVIVLLSGECVRESLCACARAAVCFARVPLLNTLATR